jgi:hypothetical protein
MFKSNRLYGRAAAATRAAVFALLAAAPIVGCAEKVDTSAGSPPVPVRAISWW